MRILATFCLLLFTVSIVSAQETRTVKSPPHRVAMLELYTSEGCSSCPPADRWLSKLRKTGISERRLVPMAFHVTYWDYIGWRDSFGKEQYDLRQRHLGRANGLNTIYTPQFVLDGKDFRRYARFTGSVQAINDEQAEVDLSLSLSEDGGKLSIDLLAETARSEVKDIALFIAVLESNLMTAVEAGENEDETLHHDYVVRVLYGPEFVSRPEEQGALMQSLYLVPGWKKPDIDIVGFAQDMRSGKVLQAVSMPLLDTDKVSSLR